ncbi:MAG: prolyl oligopeptidase family serine peptidase, partial [bacterium]|nr:prolyl oligopeptidase family serine peptidase [bacterium]
MHTDTIRKIFLAIILTLFSVNVFAQGADKKEVSIDDYVKWRNITGTSISDDGNWITYGYHGVNRDDTLYVKNIVSGKEFEIQRGSSPLISDNGRFAAYRLSLPFAQAKKLMKDKKPIPVKLEVMDLNTGDKYQVENIASFSFSEGSKYLAVKKTKLSQSAKHRGTDLLLRNLENGTNELIGSVADYGFNKPGNMLAYTVDAADTTGNGLYLIDLETGARRPLDNDRKIYERLAWDKEGTALAVLKGTKSKKNKQKNNILLVFTDLAEDGYTPVVYDPSGKEDFPGGMVISEKSGLTFSEDLSVIFLGIKEQEAEPKKSKDPVANVDVFHWKDPQIQTVQERRARFEMNRTYTSVFILDTEKLVRLTDKTMMNIQISRDGKWGIGSDNRKYVSDWKERQADYYLVNTLNGERKLILEGQKRTLGISPDSRHFIYWKDSHVWDYSITSDDHINLTENAPVSFVNAEYDNPGTKPLYGVTGWTKDGKNVILNHRYDLWLQPLDGGQAVNLTKGAGDADEIRFRYIKTSDPDEYFIDLAEPVLLSAYGEWTKKEGFYSLTNSEMEQLVYVDKHFGRVSKAKDADRLMYTIETYRDFPDYYVSNLSFTEPKRMTDAIPFQSQYKWGYRILFDFQNSQGIRLQGTLALPDDYKEGSKLPMIVNFYAKKSQEMHYYYSPQYLISYRSGNIGPVSEFGAFNSNGYLVMQLDVHFNTGTTHDDMLDCVESAVKKVIDMGYADPDHIALCGGSFSGGGSAFISTKSDMFACIASRAAPINLAGEFNILFSGSGQNNHSYDIYGQGRYGTNPFDDFELYRSQSPITHVKNMNTPLLYLHGKLDGSVEYLQGMEFYNALRFLEKPIIFLSYPEEGHNLKKLENQMDYTKRLR